MTADMQATSDSPSGNPPSLWPYLLLCAAVAVWIDLGTLHCRHHSDSLLPALVSLYRWTPFYWELDRIGMLVPLVARPFKHPLYNLLVQDALYVFCGLSALILLPRYLLRNATFPAAGALSIVAFLALTPDYYRFEYLIDTQYGVWFFLGLASLILLESPAAGSLSWPRRLAAVVLMILAHWAYCTAAMFLGPLIVFRALFFSSGGGRKLRDNAAIAELGRSLAALTIGFVAGLGLMLLAPIHDTDFAALPASDWPSTWIELTKATWSALAPHRWPWFAASAAALGLAAHAFPAVRRATPANWRAGAAAMAAAAMIVLFIGTRHWVVANAYNFRFLIPSALMTQAALLGAAVSPLAAVMQAPKWRFCYAAALPLALFAAAYSYGWPSLDRVYRDLDPYYDAAAVGPPPGIGTRDLLASGCTHIAGDYWTVWHAVFRANLALYERGERRVVWGLSLRSQPTYRYWSKIPRERMRIAVAAGGDPAADAYLAFYQLTPAAVSEKRQSLWVLQPAEAVAPQATEQKPIKIVRQPSGR